MARGKNKSERYWEQKYDDYVSSGLSQSMWCKSNGIPTSTFDYWKGKFSNKKKERIPNETDDSTDVVFAALPIIQEAAQTDTSTPIIIHLNQAKIEINNSCSDLLMASLIKAINNA